MPTKTNAKKKKSNLQRTRAITAAFKSLEKTEEKLDLGLKKLRKNLVVFRWFRS